MEKLTGLPTTQEFEEKYKGQIVYVAKPDETVIVTNDGSWLPKSKLDDELTKNKTLKEQIDSTSEELKKLKKEFKDVDGFKEKIGKMESDKTELEKKLKLADTKYALKEAYREFGVQVKYLDYVVGQEHPDLSAVVFDANGKFVIPDDKQKTLKESYKEIIGEIIIKGKNPASGSGNEGGEKKSLKEDLDGMFH